MSGAEIAEYKALGAVIILSLNLQYRKIIKKRSLSLPLFDR
jgi:hypothetical protein